MDPLSRVATLVEDLIELPKFLEIASARSGSRPR